MMTPNDDPQWIRVSGSRTTLSPRADDPCDRFRKCTLNSDNAADASDGQQSSSSRSQCESEVSFSPCPISRGNVSTSSSEASARANEIASEMLCSSKPNDKCPADGSFAC